MQIDFRYTPRNWQRDFHTERTHNTVLAVHRRAGKTKAAVCDLLDAAVRFNSDRGMFGYVAPLRTQAKAIAWSELKATCSDLIIAGKAVVQESELSVKLWNDATIRLFGADDPDSLRGYRWDRVVLDEVAQMKPDVWPEVIMPACQDRNAPALFIGTPKGVDAFSELFYAGLNDTTGKWSARKWTVHDTGVFEPDHVEEIRASMSAKAFAREFLCDFDAGAEDQLITQTDAQDAAARPATAREAAGAPVILGVDPARFGDDRTVIMRRQGPVAFPPIVLRDADNMRVADVVAQQKELHRVDAIFVDIGQGAGVVDRLRQLRHTVMEVPFGGNANDPTLYLNRRAEMWTLMRDWLRSGGAIPDDLGLKQELCAPTYSFDTKGRIKLESKDDIRKRLPEMSPDKADALALTFAAPVAAPTHLTELQKRYPHVPRQDDSETQRWHPW
ncbi:MAG: putative terminase large subunit [Prokaryotic dsDNA virus sp.]|nr:MAG: putative terminase large subunit [Prokaryotic dsDNA virus sp.]|tara:strand:- start:9324 stop:10655 length:1332 start_codon:yes stop_codon:yes gene_type:complete